MQVFCCCWNHSVGRVAETNYVRARTLQGDLHPHLIVRTMAFKSVFAYCQTVFYRQARRASAIFDLIALALFATYTFFMEKLSPTS